MTKGVPNLNRYEWKEDPRKVSLIAKLDATPFWNLKDLTQEEIYILNLPPILVEKDKYTQLSLGFPVTIGWSFGS